MHEHLRHRLLGAWSGVVTRRPWTVLAVGGLLAAACVLASVCCLSFESDRNELIAQDLEWNQRFLRWSAQFAGTHDLFVVVDTVSREGEASEEATNQARRLVRTLAERLEADPWAERVLWQVDMSALSPRAIRLASMPEFKARLEQVAQSELILQHATPESLLSATVAQIREGGEQTSEADAKAGIAMFGAMVDAFTERLETPAEQPLDLMGAMASPGGADGFQPLTTPNERLMFIIVTPRLSESALSPYDDAIANIRTAMAEAEKEFPSVSFGLTGIQVIEGDETAAATRDASIASTLAAVLIAIVLIAAFHSVRTPVMLMLSLLVGIAWSFGFVTLAVGHLQVISVVFAVVLLGLGVAFGIHLASRFELIRHHHEDTLEGFRLTLQDTFERVGPGLVTGAVTTAAAFCTTMLTDFTGVAEMGLIAGVGVLLCLLAMVTVFPAMLRIGKPLHRHIHRMEDRYIHFFEPRWVTPFIRWPRLFLGITLTFGLLSLVAASQMRFDYNLLELLPEGVESVEWQERVTRDGNAAVYTAVSTADSLEAARRRADRFRELDTVESVGGIGRLFPSDDLAKTGLIEALPDSLRNAVNEALADAAGPDGAAAPMDTSTPGLVQQIATYQRFLIPFAKDRAPQSLHEPLDSLGRSMSAFLRAAGGLPPDVRAKRLAALQKDYAAWRTQVAEMVSQILDTSPLTLDDAPKELLRSYVGEDDGKPVFALEITPKLPEGLHDPLDPAFLSRFVEDVEKIDPQVTGVIVQVYYSGAIIWQSYLWAGLYAFIAVFLLVLLDFQRVWDAALSLLPVLLAFAGTLGVMYVSGISINPANIIVLPLLFGIGIDAGVHILHRFRQFPQGVPPGLGEGTGKGISLTSYTAIIGFGSLMIARHRGMQSLGFTLTLGIGLTLLACWIVMPAWLTLVQKRRAAQAERQMQG